LEDGGVDAHARRCTFGMGGVILDLVEFCAVDTLEDEVTLTLDASFDTFHSWVETRARAPSVLRAKRGHADGTLDSLATCASLTLECARCGALVHWLAARARARKAGRALHAPGDGCTSRACAINFRRGQFLKAQLSMAVRLAAGQRKLIDWPEGLRTRTLTVLPAHIAHAAAAAAPAIAAAAAAPRAKASRRQRRNVRQRVR
jgi:hypothetical protein